jgi:hypothetical protein
MEEILQEILSPRITWWERHFAEGGGERPTKRARPNSDKNEEKKNDLDPRVSGRFGNKTDEGRAIQQDRHNVGDSSDDDDDDDSANEEDECPYPPLLIILDDCVHENTIRHSPSLNKVFIAGRHMSVDCIVLSQNVCGSGSVPPPIREQAEVLIVMALPRSVKARKMLEEEYLTVSDSIPQGAGRRIMADVTSEPHRGFVITKTNNEARSIKDYCFYFGPVPYDTTKEKHPRWVEKLKFGTEEQWAKDEIMAEKNAVRCNPHLMVYDPTKGKRKRARNGKMQQNSTRTMGLRNAYEAHVAAPSDRRIRMTGNIFGGGSSGVLNPRR